MDNFKGEEICKRNILIKKIKEADLILIPVLNRNILQKGIFRHIRRFNNFRNSTLPYDE